MAILLTAAIKARCGRGGIQRSSVDCVIVDTTVMVKAHHPSDRHQAA